MLYEGCMIGYGGHLIFRHNMIPVTDRDDSWRSYNKNARSPVPYHL